MEKKKLNTSISNPVRKIFKRANPVTTTTIKINRRQNNMVFLRCIIGPGASTRLTHKAPRETGHTKFKQIQVI
jgi:hypothetical protein